MSIGHVPHSKTTYLVLCGLFAALTAICSYITIPLGFTPVPMNLGTLGVFLAGGLLGKKYGTLSMAVYVLMGAAGIPVFAGFQAGVGVLAGPTGGFILGYITAAFIIGAIMERPCTAEGSQKLALCIGTMVLGLLACYLLGTLWFMVLTNTSLWPSLTACVLPFLPADVIKIFAASILVRRLHPFI